MHAFVYQGPGQGSWEPMSDPELEQSTDAVVRVDATTVCVGDVHTLRGDASDVSPGTVLGHEAVGEVLEVGTEVHDVVPGDEVIVSSISSCGHCMACRQGVFGQCTQGGGWLLGHEVNGTQAELVRVPFADHSVHKLPYAMDRDTAVLFSEVLPAAFELGVRNGKVRPGAVVVVVGAGPVGLSALIIAGIYSPARVISVDLSPARLAAAGSLGADDAELPGRLIADLSEGPGADVVIEAAGSSDSFVLCTQVVRSGGHIANIGMHETPVSLHLEQLCRKNVTISTGQVDTSSTPWLLDVLSPEHLDLFSRIITQRREIGDIRSAYAIASSATSTDALRTVLHPARP
ncbi:alcohol dehydrogenase catalytic domain-containing protein [Streptomyces sp. NPDC053741]|uniref:Alcohol dehydrogenase GroES domain protein n=1 Tax=Streptomyces pratensis (strain ATCC 33331 / IAF-45CD) TaxID=591167 RepID=A0A8D3WQW4_STRFA|nr:MULTISPECIES: alcohol dehydrogenase catalytic domain-containing protein [Streptomyces]MDF9873766.1 alcohol dehydrogenase [Streptomyces pratensis]MYT54329.1 alcohol dehydrogenase catalytic domain-containing protein [Streptomyces sp. SID7815]MYT55764.1 alcohol dehydrogenase catalytic domain-containing protein [Streptomyces sp. SID7834]RAS25996.1 alcohol dehydrogenase [Streptomyces avidinii]TPN29308.1 zinc-binding dehydrogenase [Mesorhizobium sp. B2-3-3]SNX80535.1 alcohol dehydrogenase [Strep